MKLVGFAATTNPATAKQFYGDALDLSLVEDGPFALVFDAGGTMLRVAVVKELTPAPYTVLGWIVPSPLPLASSAPSGEKATQ